LVALDKLSSSQDILILHIKGRAYNKNPAHVLQKKGAFNVKFDDVNADKMLCVAVCKSELTKM
jgi:hypothetical protein